MAIITDCSTVRYTFSKRDLVPRIARWWLSIQDLDFEIEHKPGASMKHVDVLSRNPSVHVLKINTDEWFLTIQMQDDVLQHLIQQIKNKRNRDLKVQYIYKMNRLFRKTLNGERLVIPKFAKISTSSKIS